MIPFKKIKVVTPIIKRIIIQMYKYLFILYSPPFTIKKYFIKDSEYSKITFLIKHAYNFSFKKYIRLYLKQLMLID